MLARIVFVGNVQRKRMIIVLVDLRKEKFAPTLAGGGVVKEGNSYSIF